MHFIYSVAALAATVLALPAQVAEDNAVEARDPQRGMLPPIYGAPAPVATTTTTTRRTTSSTTTRRTTTSSSRTTTSTARPVTTTSRTTTSTARPTTTTSRTTTSTSRPITTTSRTTTSTSRPITTTSRTTTTTPRPTTTTSTTRSSTTVAGTPILTTSAIVTSSTSTTTAAATPTGALSVLAQRAVLHHNLHRRNHSAPDVVWDDSVAASAQILAERCVFAHNTSINGGGYGQNLAAGLTADRITQSITDLWYNGEFNAYLPSFYGTEPDMSNFAAWGHFTQVVWSTTTSIGCYVADCRARGLQGVSSNVPPYLTVCNYKPPGNYIGRFGQSVGRPLGQPTINWQQGL